MPTSIYNPIIYVINLLNTAQFTCNFITIIYLLTVRNFIINIFQLF